MPSKKKKYNARFPPARIKKIMQTDEEVGKVAAAVPVIISRALELFIDSLIEKTASVTRARNAKTLSASHIKQAIHSEKMFDFLKDLVKNVPDHQTEEDADPGAPSGSGVVEKKPKVSRPRKPKEEEGQGFRKTKEQGGRGPGRPRGEGTRGPGRPRKVKIEEKKESSSEESDEETDTDEEQTGEEDDSQTSQTCYSSQEDSTSQSLPQGHTAQSPGGGEASRILELGATGFASLGVSAVGGLSVPVQAEASQAAATQTTANVTQSVPPTHSHAQSEIQAKVPNCEGPAAMENPVLSQGQPTVAQVQRPEANAAPPNVPPFQQPYRGMYQGYPMQNMMFPQYPFMPGGQQFFPLPQPSSMSPLPVNTAIPFSTQGTGSIPTQVIGNMSTQGMASMLPQSVRNMPAQFMPGAHPGFMMPQMGPTSSVMPFASCVSGLPKMSGNTIGPPPPLVPISSKNSEGDTSVPLDMSVAGKTRSQSVSVPILTHIPTPRGMAPFRTPGVVMPAGSAANSSGEPFNQTNQTSQETVSRSQTMGPSPGVTSVLTQSSVQMTENGKHKQNDDTISTVAKKPKQRHFSDTSVPGKSVSLPGLASLMNKPVNSATSEDDDYDT